MRDKRVARDHIVSNARRDTLKGTYDVLEMECVPMLRESFELRRVTLQNLRYARDWARRNGMGCAIWVDGSECACKGVGSQGDTGHERREERGHVSVDDDDGDGGCRRERSGSISLRLVIVYIAIGGESDQT